MGGKQARRNDRRRGGKQVYELQVDLIGGPVEEDFLAANPRISRTIEILGNQTLEEFHWAIFDAFDRFDEHMYEFQVGGKCPHDPDARTYLMPEAKEGPFGDPGCTGLVTQTTVAALDLKEREAFLYW
ncbi:MAG TPA: hypothetical protein VM389_12035, partial [Phycisphaerae bacterium]|nr:hypothetical protein [Phycisphaerae bacterium]